MTGTDVPCHDAQPSIAADGSLLLERQGSGRDNAPCWDRLDALQGRFGPGTADHAALFHEIPQPIWFEDWSALKARLEGDHLPDGVDPERHLLDRPDELRALYGLVRIVDMNAAAVAFYLGADRDELMGRLIQDPPTGSLAAAARMIADLLAGARGMDWILDGPEDERGRPRWMRATWYLPPSARDNWSRLVFTVQDVSDQKLAEAELARAKAAADAANRAKGEFLANVSHELRTPLNAIAGFSELLLEEKLGPLGHDAYLDYARYIRDGGEHLLDLINDLLDLSRVEAGVASLKVDTIDVRDIVDGAVRIVQDRARRSGLALDVNMPRYPLEIVADARKLRQIVVNLLSNAVKYTPPGGRVTVDCRRAADSAVELVVRDTGIGISAADLPIAMERFGRIPQRGAAPVDGVGLGLPLTKALVELHGGSFRLDSVPGQGTIATVVLPA
jgi:signal transduction histidine kinase